MSDSLELTRIFFSNEPTFPKAGIVRSMKITYECSKMNIDADVWTLDGRLLSFTRTMSFSFPVIDERADQS